MHPRACDLVVSVVGSRICGTGVMPLCVFWVIVADSCEGWNVLNFLIHFFFYPWQLQMFS